MLRRMLPLVVAVVSCLLFANFGPASTSPDVASSRASASPARLVGSRIEPARLPSLARVPELGVRAEAKENTATMVSSLVVRVDRPASLARQANAWIDGQVGAFERQVAASGSQSSLATKTNLCGRGAGLVCLTISSTASVAESTTHASQTYFVKVGSDEAIAAQDLFTDEGRAQLASFLAELDAATFNQNAEAYLHGAYFDADGSLVVPVSPADQSGGAAYRIEGIESLLTDKGAQIRQAIMAPGHGPSAVQRSQGAQPSDTRPFTAPKSSEGTPSRPQFTFPNSPLGPNEGSPLGSGGGSEAGDDYPPQPPAGEVDCSREACIALTFDDGPGPYTDQLLDRLRDADARATFFVTGPQVDARPGQVKRASDEGHILGNHSWTHTQLTALSPEQISWELVRTNEALARAGAPSAVLMRPPYGAKNPKVMESLAAHSMVGVLWNVDTEDWKNLNAETTTQRALDGARPGAIILMHDIHPSTVVAVPKIVSELRRQGYRLVTVPELLGNAPEIHIGRSVYSQSTIK